MDAIIYSMYGKREEGEEPVSISTRFSLGVENERTGAGHGSRIRLARLNSQARAGQGNNQLPCLAEQKKDRQSYPVHA